MFFTGGDWPFFFHNTISSLSWFPEVWSATNGNGLGQNVAFVLGYKTFFAIQVKFYTEVLHLPWVVVEKLIFFLPFWVLSVLSSFLFSRHFLKSRILSLLSVVIFSTNTYSLMLVGGGQMGVAIAYAFSPMVLLMLLKLLEKPGVFLGVLTGFILGVLLMVDPRFAGIVLFIASIFLLFQFSFKRMAVFMLSVFISIFLNMFWILPFAFSGTGGLTDAYTSADILYFLSFATFENSMGLLHPNWPENFFGKVGFMRAEFLVLPILAFSVFLFKTKKDIKILGIVGLVGIFLSKGVNLPFGGVYYFLSDTIPAFTMFRDATKWYLLVIISYSILIPLSLSFLSIAVSKTTYKLISKNMLLLRFLKSKKYIYVVLAAFLLFWGFSVRELLLRELGGTFTSKSIPKEYAKLEEMVSEDKDFSRTLWVSQVSRFGFYSSLHPAISSYDLITSHDVKPTIQYLKSKKAEKFIKESGVSYIIVPYDSLGEIFLTDRKYDDAVRMEFINQLKKIPWISQDKTFKQIALFKVNDPLPHAFTNKMKQATLKQVSPTYYKGSLSSYDSSLLIFSETFDPSWRLYAKGTQVRSKLYNEKFNSFELPSGTTTFELRYAKQNWVNVGVGISIFTVGCVITYIGTAMIKKTR